MAKSQNAKYQDAWRENLAKAGMRRIELKCHEEDAARIKAYVQRLNKQREKSK